MIKKYNVLVFKGNATELHSFLNREAAWGWKLFQILKLYEGDLPVQQIRVACVFEKETE